MDIILQEKFGIGEDLEINFTVSSGLNSMYITLWKDFTDDFAIELISPNGETTGMLLPNERNRNTVIGGTAVHFFNTEPVPYNEEQELLFVLKRIGTGIVSSRKLENKNKGNQYCGPEDLTFGFQQQHK